MSKAAKSTENILAMLNDAQREAVMHGKAPLLIIAGAGSGKTTTLVHRVAHLIASGVAAHRILLLTFTRRAAGEMLHRVDRVLPRDRHRQRVWGGTFHATGARLIRMYGEAIGVNPRFTIHDRGDSEDLMRSLVVELNLTQSDKKFPKKGTLMAIHSFTVNSGRTLNQVLRSNFSAHRDRLEPLKKLFAAYERRKQALAVFDYDDLLCKWCELLEHRDASSRILDRFDYVLVDEYQDTNPLQGRLLKLLCPDGRGLAVVGDDAQSIYSFRAATVRNILDFPKQFRPTRVVKLEQNYRSTEPLLAASNFVIADAREQYQKKLWSDRAEGARPQLVTCYDDDEQSEFIVRRILDHKNAGMPLREQAVLFRASHHSISLETELARHDIPFVKYGGLKFVESAHVKDLMSFLRLAENPRDSVAGSRVLMLLPGVGPKKAMQWTEMLAGSDIGFQCWTDVKPPAKTKELWPKFVDVLRDVTLQEGDVPGQIDRVLEFYQPLLEQKYDNPDKRVADLEQLREIAAKFDQRAELLSDLAIDPPSSEADLSGAAEARDDLVLSTIHSAKGLEWQSVYVLHASDGLIPPERSFDDVDAIEEERRMFYVALTRAANWLYVCHAETHYEREGRFGGWNRWDDLGYREVTRFLSPQAHAAFDLQQASQFQLADIAAPRKPKAKSKSKSRRKPTNKRKKTGRIRT